jgi:glycosyltransferase involved in cell wall biosynthesis
VSGIWSEAVSGVQPDEEQQARVEGTPSRPIRVIHVGQTLVRAGIENWLKSLIRFTNPRRVQFVRSIATTEQVDPSMVSELGVPVEVGGKDVVRRAARECDVLLCWGPPELGAWLNGTRPNLCVFVAHGETEWTRNILDGCAPIVDHVVAVSREVLDKVCNGFPTTVIPNGIDPAHIAHSRSRAAVRKRLGFGPRDFVLGYVGRFSMLKRPEILIQTVAQSPRHYKALMVGWGPMRNELMEMANHLIPGRYAFVMGNRYLGDYYHAMDAFCLASDIEGFGLVIVEAMMCGVPVIARPVGIVPEFIKDRISGLVVSGEPESFYRAAELLRRHPDWARAIALEGKRVADKRGHASRMAHQYEELFQNLLRGRSNGDQCS